METEIGRRSFLVASTVLGLGAAAKAATGLAPQSGENSSFPSLPPELAKAVVGAAHRDLDKVKELVEKCPPLARAVWDWGFGDYESALGAASHVGRRDIATYLMERGARPDIFTFAMMGNLDAVKAMVAGQRNVQTILGPHGIPLLRHAQAGGEPAAEVVKYLQTLDNAGREVESFTLAPEQLPEYVGTYRLEGPDPVQFEIKAAKGGKLTFNGADQAVRNLNNHGAGEFSPAGVPEVKLVFELKDGRAVSITSKNLDPAFKAVRVN